MAWSLFPLGSSGPWWWAWSPRLEGEVQKPAKLSLTKTVMLHTSSLGPKWQCVTQSWGEVILSFLARDCLESRGVLVLWIPRSSAVDIDTSFLLVGSISIGKSRLFQECQAVEIDSLWTRKWGFHQAWNLLVCWSQTSQSPELWEIYSVVYKPPGLQL